MATITFSKSNTTNVIDGSSDITESGIHWALFDVDVNDVNLLTEIVEQGSALSLTAGEGVLTVSAASGTYLMVIQSSVNNSISLLQNIVVV